MIYGFLFGSCIYSVAKIYFFYVKTHGPEEKKSKQENRK
jgi:hypothetical protein